MPRLICSLAEPPAKPSPSPDCEKDLRTPGGISLSPSSTSPTSSTPTGSCGRTSPESSVQKTTPSVASLEGLPAKMMRSSRQGVNGRTLVACLDPREQSRGESSTPNISEWPNAAAVCSLSQVLVTMPVPPRFFLSGKACAGILRRAEKRGKDLPIPLHRALTQVAAGFERGGDTRGQDPVVAVPDVADTLRSGSSSEKAHGKVNGTDRMTLVPTFWNGEQVTQTLDAVLAKGQTMPEKNRFPAVLVPAVTGPMAANGGTCRKHGYGMGQQDWENGFCIPVTTHTLKAEGFDASEDGTGRGTPLVPVAYDDRNQTAMENLHHTLRADGIGSRVGDAVAYSDAAQTVAFVQNTRDEVRLMNGDGSIVGALAAQPGMKQTCYVAYNEVAGTLKANGAKSGTENGAEVCSRLVGVPTVTGPMAANGGTSKKHGYGMGQQDWENGFCLPTPAMQVRRLLPVECERLQGFPDGHTEIPWRKKPAAECPDGPRYKAIGNSMATPCMFFIGSRIKKFIEGEL